MQQKQRTNRLGLVKRFELHKGLHDKNPYVLEYDLSAAVQTLKSWDGSAYRTEQLPAAEGQPFGVTYLRFSRVGDDPSHPAWPTPGRDRYRVQFLCNVDGEAKTHEVIVAERCLELTQCITVYLPMSFYLPEERLAA